MQNPFQPGDQKVYTKRVEETDLANFPDAKDIPGGGLIHQVYSTFALARDAEWACRLFVLKMKDEHEEGIGSKVSVDHKAPAFLGEEVTITATLLSVERNKVLCRYEARVQDRLVASGEQEQRIIPKDKLDQHFQEIQGQGDGK